MGNTIESMAGAEPGRVFWHSIQAFQRVCSDEERYSRCKVGAEHPTVFYGKGWTFNGVNGLVDGREGSPASVEKKGGNLWRAELQTKFFTRGSLHTAQS